MNLCNMRAGTKCSVIVAFLMHVARYSLPVLATTSDFSVERKEVKEDVVIQFISKIQHLEGSLNPSGKNTQLRDTVSGKSGEENVFYSASKISSIDLREEGSDQVPISTPRRSLKSKKKTASPSSQPTSQPSPSPSASSLPSSIPSDEPSSSPSDQPSLAPSMCHDEPGWQLGGISIYANMNCTDIKSDVPAWCNFLDTLYNSTHGGKRISEACCDCGGGDHQTPSPSYFPSSKPSVSNAPSPAYFPSESPTEKPSACADEPGWTFTDKYGHYLGCDALYANPGKLCLSIESVTYDSKPASLACCVCGGGKHLSVEPSKSPTSEPSSTPSLEPSLSNSPSDEPSFSPSDEPSNLPSSTPSDLPTISMMPSNIPSMTFAAVFDGDYCNYHTECRERPKYSKARRLEAAAPRLNLTRRRNARHLKEPSLGSKKRKKTSSPSFTPSSLPSSSPSDIPSSNPSDVPSTSPSDVPSTSPSTSPSSMPSSSPSSSPSKEPSSMPSSIPSSTPSTSPSNNPSDVPSLSPSNFPSSIPSYLPSLSVFPSAAPQHFGRCIANTCQAEDLVIKTPTCKDDPSDWYDSDGPVFDCGWYAQGSRCAVYGNRFENFGKTAKKACCVCGGGDKAALESCTTTFAGSYGNMNDGNHDQDFGGGVVVGPNTTITMFGNAWKAYELCEPYEISKTSILQFKFTITEEAEGHAICLDEDLNEDTFGGSRKRCIMLTGTQVDRWDNIKKYNLGATKDANARQSSNMRFQIGDAEKAVDGIINPYWSYTDGAKFNSITETQVEENPWWEVSLGSKFVVQDVIIYNRLDACCIDDLSDFNVTILDDMTTDDPDDTNRVWEKQVNISGNGFDKYHVIVPEGISGSRVRITLNKVGSLQLTEVQIIGKKDSDEPQLVRIPIGDMFSSSDAVVRYISFIQDNDRDTAFGESEFTEIEIVEDEETLVTESFRENTIRESDLLDTNVQSSLKALINLNGEPGSFWNVTYDNSTSDKKIEVTYHECQRDASLDIPPLAISPTSSNYWDECKDAVCGRCKGDCDNNSECDGNLECYDRSGSEAAENPTDVGRGCEGTNSIDYDYCVVPQRLRRVPCLPSDNAHTTTFRTDKVDRWMDEDPTSISVASNGRFIVGFSGATYTYLTPSERPSKSPSKSPSESPSESPSSPPTKQPTKPPTNPVPFTLGRRSANPPNTSPFDTDDDNFASLINTIDGLYHGVVVIYDPQEKSGKMRPYAKKFTNNIDVFVDELNHVVWEPDSKNDTDLLGDKGEDYHFGAAVAISAEGSTIAIASPKYEQSGGRVQIYDETEFDWTDKGTLIGGNNTTQNFGKRLVLSPDGNAIAIAAEDGVDDVFYVYKRFISGGNKWTKIGEGIMPNGNKIEALSLSIVNSPGGPDVEVDVLDDNTVIAFELIGSCSDSHAKTVGDVTDPSSLRCYCRDGFLSSGGVGQLLEDNADFCVPCMASSNILLSHSSLTFQFSRNLKINVNETSLLRHEPDEDVEITITDDKFQAIEAGDPGKGTIDYTFFDLKPGSRYTVSLTQTSETDIDATIQCPVVTSCSCDHSSYDRTGRPEDLVVTQKEGHITFTFRDNSYCEEGFSFTRVDVVDEFMFDASKFAISFTSDFHYSAADECNTVIAPGMEVTDDLSLSNLLVGKEYAYCVRAIKEGHYMDSPYAGLQSSAVLTSSGPTCASHHVRWEASFHGIVTTELDAGRLPIENVLVTWNLLDAELNTLECIGCSGSTNTTDGGSFNIEFNVDHEYLAGKNDDEIPVKIFFSKTSAPNITHQFLCEDGVKPCDIEDGYIVYLRHLQFKAPLHIFDDTSVPFSGRIYVADTPYGSEPGCAIPNAEVCLVHNSTRNDVEENLVCVDADGEGKYIAPIVIGSTVHSVNVYYNDHEFEPSEDNPGPYPEKGLQITADKFYLNHNFKDVSQAEVTVEVVGGKCDKRLGKSTVLIKVLNCDWVGKEYTQSGTKNTYLNVPAHFLHLEVLDIVDSGDKRIQRFYNFFQAGLEGPLVREIDLLDTAQEFGELEEGEREAKVADGNTGLQDEAEKEKEEEDIEEIDEKVKADRTTVRFQFDGDLMMEVIIDKDELSCTDYDEDKFGTGNSFHVMNYMTLFNVRVNLEYEIMKDKIYCDIVEDGLKIKIENYVGGDTADSWYPFYESLSDESKFALTHCWPRSEAGACTFNVTHDSNDEGESTGNAGLDYSFVTGRPNIVPHFTKDIRFAVQDHPNVVHVASFFVEGLYSKGPGNSFALPTHEPIMILRDPPGGDSQASYEYVQSTVRIVESETTASLGVKTEGEIEGTVEKSIELCAGGGFGAIVLACDEIVEIDADLGIEWEGGIGGEIVHSEEAKSNEFSSTWSYTTSDDPLYAGYMSDVFVVPNLNVLYEIVYVVSWNNEACHPARKNYGQKDEDWPSKVLFSVDAASSENSLAFYSRFQLLDQKIPELKYTFDTLTLKLGRMEEKEKVCCCVDEQDDGECPTDNSGQSQEMCECEAADIQKVRDRQKVIKDGLDGWTRATNIEKNQRENKKNIVDWFSSVGTRGMNTESQLELSDQAGQQSSSLLPPSLVDDAVRLNNDFSRRRQQALTAIEEDLYIMKDGNIAEKEHVEEIFQSEEVRRRLDNSKDKLRATKRIQFDGGAGMYEMTMSKEKVYEWKSLSCWLGCNIQTEFELKADLDFKVEGAGFGVEGDDINFGIALEVEHTSVKGGEEHETTEIGFVLGDPDLGDEFVVEVYFDERYGSMVFETIAGRSACPHEENTLKNEDPVIEVSAKNRPSQFVFPDDPMVFTVELTNMGVGAFSEFLLYSTQSTGIGGLSVTIDGSAVSEDGISVFMLKETLITKQVVVTRGPNVYQDAPVEITLQSKCEDPKNMDDLKEHVFRPTVKLSNTEDSDGKDVIEWVQPCPVVHWAGELNRDRGFLVNLESETKEKLSVTVFNPETGSFSQKKINGRLEHVYFKYRKVGSLHWSTAKTVDKNGKDQIMDFAADIDLDDPIESDYGYATLEWNIEPRLVKQGSYEIYIETVCTALTGGPSDINGYQTQLLSGVIDFSRPMQYGEPLPLKTEVIPGEEIVVVFDEVLDCSEPFSFDIELRILNTVTLNNDQLQVTCEGRRIGFQIDTSFGITYEDIVGKQFEVEIGKIGDTSVANVYDMNGNALEYNILFSRSFANIDLSSASTSFRLLVSNYPCSRETVGDEIPQDMANEISSAAGLSDTSRITMHDVSCHSGENVSARVHIAPATAHDDSLRKLENIDNDNGETPVNILYNIRDASVIDSSGGKGVRRLDMLQKDLSYSISDMKLLPCDEDIEKFQTHPDNKEEESLLYRLALNLEHSLETPDESTNLILSEMKKERDTMKQEREVMEAKLSEAIQEIDKINKDRMNDIESMFLYSCAVMVGCVVIAILAFLQLRK